MKNKIISFLHKLIGFENYLFVFALFIYYKLRWDKNERDFLKIFDLIAEDGLILDIGANIGVMTSHFAKKRNNSKVISFEPMPANINTLKRIVHFFKLKNVKVIEKALSNSEGEVDMIMPIVDSALKHGLSHIKSTSDQVQEGNTYKVKMLKLDDVPDIKNTKDKITAVKIDVEGHELCVLEGAKKTLLKHKPIIYCELWPDTKRETTIDYLESLGFTPYILHKKKLIHFNDFEGPSQNFYFIPQ